MKRDLQLAVVKREEDEDEVNTSGTVAGHHEVHQLAKRADKLPNLTKVEAKAVQTVSAGDLSFWSMKGLALWV
jgi:hypothetical protein